MEVILASAHRFHFNRKPFRNLDSHLLEDGRDYLTPNSALQYFTANAVRLFSNCIVPLNSPYSKGYQRTDFP